MDLFMEGNRIIKSRLRGRLSSILDYFIQGVKLTNKRLERKANFQVLQIEAEIQFLFFKKFKYELILVV